MMLTSVRDIEGFLPSDYLRAALKRDWISQHGKYEDFVEQLYRDLDDVIYRMQAGPELRQKDSEDRLSADLLLGLNIQGYTAVPDGKAGGHVDLSVKLGQFSWIGEAKKDGNFKEGYLQLTTRYKPASGNFSHNQGGLIFYLVSSEDAKGRLDSWRTVLTSEGHVCTDCHSNPLAFFSDHKLAGPGTMFKVRTMGVSLYHQPKDKSARNSRKKATAKAAKKIPTAKSTKLQSPTN